MLMQLAMIVGAVQLRLERRLGRPRRGEATLRLLLQPGGSKARCTKPACSHTRHT